MTMPILAGGYEPAPAPTTDRTDVSDVPVLVRHVDRDTEFAAFMETAAPALGRTAWLLCGDVHQADELVQQTLVRTYLAWPRARERDPLAYARRTLANLRVESWRRRRREVLVAPVDVPEHAQVSGADRHAERDQLVRALATLTPRQRRVVVLRHFEGMSEREVADDLGVSVGTVKATSSRSLARLRDVLRRRHRTRDRHHHRECPMSIDDDFARTLAARIETVVPDVPVDTSGVVRRARRRRATVRGLTTTAVAAVVVGAAAWGAGAQPRVLSTPVAPAVEPTWDTPSPEPSATAQDDYWYTKRVSTDADGTEVDESWLSTTRPGLLVTDGDVANATGVGPRAVIGRFRIDGEWVDMLDDAARLPTDATELAAVLRASVEPDRRSGTDDDKVFGMARDLLLDPVQVPADLRRAAWTVASGLPGASVSDGVDSTGRAGKVLVYTGDGATRLVLDPATALVLEEVTDGRSATYVELHTSSTLPHEPTLAESGCVSWATC